MSVDPKTPMIRKHTHGQLWPSLGTVALLAALSLLASMPAQAVGPHGETPDRIFTDDLKSIEALYVPPKLIESEAFPSPGEFVPADRITIPFFPGSHDPGEIRLLVDGKDVTESSVVAEEDPDRYRIVHETSLFMEPGLYVVEARISSVSFTWVVNALDVKTMTLMPEEGAVLPSGSRPTIGLHFGGLSGRFDSDSVRLFLGGPGYENPDPELEHPGYEGPTGVDVAAHAVLTDSSIEYIPPSYLENGKYFLVEFEARDRIVSATVYRFSWLFSVGPRPRIIAREPVAGMLPVGSKPVLRIHVASEDYPLAAQDLYYDGYDQDTIIVPSPGEDTQVEDLGSGTYLITHDPAHEFVPLRRYCYSLLATNSIGLSNEDFLEETCFQIDAEWGRAVEILTPQQDAIVATDSIEVRVRGTASRGAMRRVLIQGKVTPARYNYDDPNGVYQHNFLEVELAPGDNLIDIEVEFDGVPDRHTERRQLRVRYVPAPEIEIDTPAVWQSFRSVGPDGSSPDDATNLTGTVQRPILIEERRSTAVRWVEINSRQLQPNNLSAFGMQARPQTLRQNKDKFLEYLEADPSMQPHLPALRAMLQGDANKFNVVLGHLGDTQLDRAQIADAIQRHLGEDIYVSIRSISDL